MNTNQQLNSEKSFYRATTRQRIFAGIVFLGIAVLFSLFWLAAHQKIVIWPYPCGFEQDYGLPCLGCGMTTAAVTFSTGRIFKAFYIQPAGALFCSVLVFTAFLALLISIFGIYFRFLKRFFIAANVKYILLAVIIIFACGWMVTLARELAVKS